MFSLLNAYMKNDPAAKSRLEVFFLYPGFKSYCIHQVAHWLYKRKVPFFPRALSEFSRWMTGIEIHPGASLGRNVVIDHGMGIVIGETAVIGNNVVLYQGVTLGGTSFNKVKRHPTLEDGVIIGCGAIVLGNIVIGKNAQIGANSVVVKDVPAGYVAIGVPAKNSPRETNGETDKEEAA